MDIMEHVTQVEKDLRSIKNLLAAQLILNFQLATRDEKYPLLEKELKKYLKDCGVDLDVKSN